jgi:hypothetical protein
MGGARFTVWISGSTADVVEGYHEFRSGRVTAVMDRYRSMTMQSKPRLTAAEWWALVRILWRDRLFTADEARLLWAKVEEYVREGWSMPGVDGHALLKRLKAMSTWELYAVADIVERIGCMDEEQAKLSREEQVERAGGLVEREAEVRPRAG